MLSGHEDREVDGSEDAGARESGGVVHTALVADAVAVVAVFDPTEDGAEGAMVFEPG